MSGIDSQQMERLLLLHMARKMCALRVYEAIPVSQAEWGVVIIDFIHEMHNGRHGFCIASIAEQACGIVECFRYIWRISYSSTKSHAKRDILQ